MVFLKKILMKLPKVDHHLMRHILIGVIVSYREYRKKLEFHGSINQKSIIGISNPEAKLYPNNTKGDLFNSDFQNQHKLESELYYYKYRLIYHHGIMLTIKEWLNNRESALKKNRK